MHSHIRVAKQIETYAWYKLAYTLTMALFLKISWIFKTLLWIWFCFAPSWIFIWPENFFWSQKCKGKLVLFEMRWWWKKCVFKTNMNILTIFLTKKSRKKPPDVFRDSLLQIEFSFFKMFIQTWNLPRTNFFPSK